MNKSHETQVDRAAVAARAYELFLARGGTHGHDLEDWLRAEAELKQAAAKNNGGSRPSRATEETEAAKTAKRRTRKS